MEESKAILELDGIKLGLIQNLELNVDKVLGRYDHKTDEEWAKKWQTGNRDDAPFIAPFTPYPHEAKKPIPSEAPWTERIRPNPMQQEKENLQKDIEELRKRKKRERDEIKEIVQERDKISDEVHALKKEAEELRRQIKRLRETQAVLVENEVDLTIREV